MNQKLNNTCIKCESVEHGAEIVKFYEDNGYFIEEWDGRSIGFFYGVFDQKFDCTHYLKNAKVLTLQEAKDLVKENQYPKVMWVSDSESFLDAKKRVVFMEKCGKFLAWCNVETLELSKEQAHVNSWKYAKDIEDETEFQNKTRERIAAIEKELVELKKLIK